jgi:hypothetical protein
VARAHEVPREAGATRWSWDWGLPTAAAASACVLVVAVTAHHGLSLSPDSAVYLSSADHLLEGDGLTSYSGHKFAVFPPGFPAVAAAIGRALSVDVAAAARILNVLCVVAIVAAACVLLRRHVESHRLQLVAAAIFASASPLMDVATHAWSEPLFIALALLGILAIEELVEQPTRPASLAAVVALVWSAFLVRYIGVTLALSAVGSLLIASRGTRSTGARLAAASVTGALLVAVPAAWVVRNLAVTGTAFGGRATPEVAMTEQLRRTADEIVSWVFPRYLPAELRLAGISLVIAAGVGLAVVAQKSRKDVRPPRPSMAPLALFALGYLVLLEVSAARTRIDPLGARLLSPLFVPTVVLGVALLDRALRTDLQSRRVVTNVLTLALVCWSVLSVVAGGKHATALAAGDGYSSAAWRSSALALHLRRSPPIGTLFSNRPDAVWATTRLDARCLPPQLGKDLCLGSAGAPHDLRALEASTAGAKLAWFATPTGPAAPARRGRIRFHLLAHEADGSLYTLDLVP